LVATLAEPTTLAQWTDLAGKVTPRTGIFIDGRYRDAHSGDTFESINPATGQLLARIASAQDADVDAAVAGARTSFEQGYGPKHPPHIANESSYGCLSSSLSTAPNSRSSIPWIWASW
jgi:hypothetical protein